jgi:hypothetical protein
MNTPQTRTPLPCDDTGRMLLRAVRTLAAEGITPDDVLRWDASRTDGAVNAMAGALDMYQALMGTIGPEVAVWTSP